MDFDTFTASYIEAALWSSQTDKGEPMDEDYGVSDIHPETLAKMVADCAKFQVDNGACIPDGDEVQAGHDFWLTRNHHGSGFWDGDWPEPIATTLTKAAHAFGEFQLYVDENNKIHGLRG